ncbi:sensor histidine kinase [Actinophytocola sp.]|uniref:sensor histidine kinase n=1 Tax=Actinophytocola sp. TaxID=1872138 RepID=UPI002D592824|nr:histidine kinase [Actinophytocola sp.]HYQ65354.1 histidine kinase [Actinophytocola sp.]
MTAAGPPARRSVLVAEIVAIGVAVSVDIVLALQRTAHANGWLSQLSSVGAAAAVLAVLRRRFPGRIGLLGAAVAGLSLFSTTVTVVAEGIGVTAAPEPFVTEVLAAALMTGAVCRRLSPVHAASLAAASGVAVVAAPVVRFGIGSTMALFAVPAALMWGVALAIGVILRDADARHQAEVEQVRTNERLELARELHDLVTHYISGIVVRVQAARSLSGRQGIAAEDPVDVYVDVEQAGAEALTAMRKLVGMLRNSHFAVPLPSSRLGDVIRSAAPQATVDTVDDVGSLSVPTDVASTVHRVVLEATTNARRHAPRAEVTVQAHREDAELVLRISNDGASGPHRPAGYGLTGMTERVAALGGVLTAGPQPGDVWLVSARLPLDPTVPRGV